MDEFDRVREWGQFHTRRNLILALVSEIGELAETVQWLGDEDIPSQFLDGSWLAHFEEEVAEVAIYLVRLAQVTGVDLAEAMNRKLEVNEERYPVDSARGSATKATRRVE